MTVKILTKKYERTFNRFELKYQIHHKTAQEFLRRISAHVRPDIHAGLDGFYKSTSLYYDTSDLTSYWEKIDGEKFRRKVRIRLYRDDLEYAFLEIKQRINQNVQKRRCRFPLKFIEGEMQKIQNGGYTGGVDKVLDEVFYLSHLKRLEPKLVVTYNRAAYFDHYQGMRITVDRNLRCRNLSLNLDHNQHIGRLIIPLTMVILELKFNDTIPRWLCTILNSLDLQIVRISKYCLGVERMRMQESYPNVGI